MTLNTIARKIVEGHKGILAADESNPTIKKRFDAIKVESTEENRRDYRELMFKTKGMAEFISGVILFDETIRQKAADGTPFTNVLKSLNVIPGIKVDAGTRELAGSPGEQITEGLDGLRERLKDYFELGARFAKWRAVINITDTNPSYYCLYTNAHALARYAKLCQEQGIVPIVEPEVIMDGSHTIERCYDVTEETLKVLFDELSKQKVELEGLLLKPNMVIAGTKATRQGSVQEVADLTVKCLLRTVPAAVPGIVFLSGGQSDELATAHLNAMNAKHKNLPWALTYSYGRALQAAAQKAWCGKKENVPAAQQAFYHRAKCNSLAAAGKYSDAIERGSV